MVSLYFLSIAMNLIIWIIMLWIPVEVMSNLLISVSFWHSLTWMGSRIQHLKLLRVGCNTSFLSHFQQGFFCDIILWRQMLMLVICHSIVICISSILRDDGGWIHLGIIRFLFEKESIRNILLSLENWKIFNWFIFLETILSTRTEIVNSK